jgi:ribosome-binding factor A
VGRSREYARSTRVEEMVRREVSDIIRRVIKDPRVAGVTLTRIKVADDLRNATVFFGVLDRIDQASAVEEALNHSAGFIHHHLVRRLAQKVVPRLVFRFDRNLDYSFHIDKLLHQIEIPPEGGEYHEPTEGGPEPVEGPSFDKYRTSPVDPPSCGKPPGDDEPS